MWLSSCGCTVRSFGQWATAAKCAVLPTANTGQYITLHCNPLLFWFPCKWQYINVQTFDLFIWFAVDPVAKQSYSRIADEQPRGSFAVQHVSDLSPMRNGDSEGDDSRRGSVCKFKTFNIFSKPYFMKMYRYWWKHSAGVVIKLCFFLKFSHSTSCMNQLPTVCCYSTIWTAFIVSLLAK